MRLSLVLVFLLLNLSCQKAQQAAEINYFDLAGLMKQQIEYFKKEKPGVFKKIILGDKTEELNLDSLDWEKELALFVQADINKRAYSKSYSTIQKENETEYKLTSGESLPVTSMRIIFGPRKKLKQIYIITVTSNYLMEAQRKLSLSFENGGIKSYGVNSEQELFIGDPEKLEISGKIIEQPGRGI